MPDSSPSVRPGFPLVSPPELAPPAPLHPSKLYIGSGTCKNRFSRGSPRGGSPFRRPMLHGTDIRHSSKLEATSVGLGGQLDDNGQSRRSKMPVTGMTCAPFTKSFPRCWILSTNPRPLGASTLFLDVQRSRSLLGRRFLRTYILKHRLQTRLGEVGVRQGCPLAPLLYATLLPGSIIAFSHSLTPSGLLSE